MLGRGFSIREAISFGWAKSLEHIGLIIKVALAMMVAQIVLLIGFVPISLLFYVTQESYLSIIPLILFVAYSIAVALFVIGMVRLGLLRVLLDIYERNSSEVSRLFSSFHLTLTYIGTGILYNFVFLASVLLVAGSMMILPEALVGLLGIVVFLVCIIVLVRLGFYPYSIVDKGTGPVDSLKRSWHITHGSVFRIILFQMLLGLIPVALGAVVGLNMFAIIGAISNGWYVTALLPAVLLIVSLFCLALVVPMVLLATVYVYKKLSEHADERARAYPIKDSLE